MFISLAIGCGTSGIDYANIEKIETSHIPFGINSPVGMDESVVDLGANKVEITDPEALKDIGLILESLIPVESKENRVRSNVYLKSIITLKSKNKSIELLSDKQLILIENEVYGYSEELINKLRGK